MRSGTFVCSRASPLRHPEGQNSLDASSGPRAAKQPSRRNRLDAGSRPGPPRSRAQIRFPAHRITLHPRYPLGRAVATHGACHRGSGWRLASARRTHRRRVHRHQSIGRSGPGVQAVDVGAWHRADHLERDRGGDRQWRGILEGTRLRRRLDWCPDRCRLETARSLARYRSMAIAICASCSCRRLGLRDRVPICLSVALCSVPSRRGLETPSRR